MKKNQIPILNIEDRMDNTPMPFILTEERLKREKINKNTEGLGSK